MGSKPVRNRFANPPGDRYTGTLKEPIQMVLESGLVLRAQSGFFQILISGEVVTCRLRGKLKKGPQRADLVAIGDRVKVQRVKPREGIIEEIDVRKRCFSRMDPRPQGLYQQVLLANPDQLLVVFACAQPAPHLRMLDRFLVIAEQQGIPPVIIANKSDLVDREDAEKLFEFYRPLGYHLIFTSVKTLEGIEAMRAILRDKISALTGPSGVGKSSLVACLDPGLDLHSREISSATGKGRHTTRVRELYHLPGGGFIADMPGIRALALWDIQPEELDGYFPEIRQRVGSCQFNNCTHQDEPKCAIRKAAEEGLIHPERYKSYLYMRFGVSNP